MVTLIFGLTRYYSTSYDDNQYVQSIRPNEIKTSADGGSYGDNDNGNQSQYLIFFVSLYAILLIISAFISKPDSDLFLNWSDIGIIGVIQLGAAIMLSFFLPGYAMVLIIAKRYKINPIARVLFAYLISMLISGIIGYILGLILDIPISESKDLLIGIYLVILVAFIICYPIYRINLRPHPENGYHISRRFVSYLNTKLWAFVKTKNSELLIFGSLFMLLLVYTYYLFGGVTIGDQWYHQGRALLFMSGSIREAAVSYADPPYAPLQSALLAIVTTLSGLPIVNTYASIAFFNMTYVFAFYYFFSTWIPLNMRRSKILASILFAVSSGFGWIYLLGMTVTTHPVVSQKSVLDTIVSTEPFDIFQPTNFFLSAHPEFSTGLIYIALPAGFVLLGLLRENLPSKFIFIIVVTLISVLGVLSHEEFYFFMIVGSILPLLFKIKQGNYLYLGFLLAISIVYLINTISPGKDYTWIEIFPGVPLLTLNAMFVGITWTLYLIKNKLRGLQAVQSFLGKFRSKPIKNYSLHYTRLHFLTGVLVVSIVCYIYGLSFIILAHLLTNDIIIQTAGYGGPYNIPWYLYSLKFGVTGLLGLAFVLSYLFKRFEKEIFVFGIIIIIALLAGPYYDEHRFSKYIMAGMAGFASLLIYKIIISLRSSNKPVISNIIIAIIITSASLSSILYIGFNSLILQTHDFTHTLGRRNFPISEMPLLQTLRDKMDIGSNRYNILAIPNEYNNFDDGLMATLQAFSGLPSSAVYQNPLTLNASTLDGFYRLLDDSGTKYIIIPKNSINERLRITEPVRFAMNHFQRIYEDNKYIVLEVPSFRSPSSSPGTDTAVIYDHDQKDTSLFSRVLGLKLLQYNNNTFNFGGETNFLIIQQGNRTEKAILSDYDSENGLTIWSKGIDPEEKINYVEVGFQIKAENANRTNDVGLKWREGVSKEYYVSLSKDGLKLFQNSNNKKYDRKLLYQNSEIGIDNQTSYTLAVERLPNSTNIFLNDKLRIQMAENDSINATDGISQVAISAANDIVEFGPIKIGNLSEQKHGDMARYNQYYYPLSIIALSKFGYDMFMDTDLSAFSKKQLVLTFDPSHWDDTTFNRYIEYVSKGGTVVVMDSDNFKGRFGQLFSIQSNDNKSEAFAKIVGQNNQFLNISGLVKRVDIIPSPNVNIVSTYRDKENRVVAPFAIEKHFSNGGRIVLVNSEGYFKALSKLPGQYFMSLSNISTLLDLDRGKAIPSNSPAQNITAQAYRFIGDLKILGNITLKSSSLLIPDKGDNSYNIYAERISILNKSNNQTRIFNNVTIKDLKLIGQYEATVNSRGTLNLPSKDSQHEYISVLMPSKFNVTVDVYPNKSSSGQIVTLNSSSVNTIRVNNDSIINIYNIITDPSQESIPVLMKSPKIKVNGHIGFNNSNFDPYFINTDIPLDGEGELNAKINFIDNYEQRNVNASSKLQYLTYLQSIIIDEGINRGKVTINLPGDISDHAKRFGPQIPLKEALLSSTNLRLILSIIVVTTIGSRIIWSKIKLQNGNKMPL
jgi:hypothetical protein